jgi:thiol-disulfide isomerase/thioredoxin
MPADSPSSPSAVIDLSTQEEVEDLMDAAGGAAIVDFWSPTCGPCMAMAPAFAAAAAVCGDEPVRFLKINTQAHPELAAPFRIRAVPTLLFVLNGEIVDVRVGTLGAEDLQKKARWLGSKVRGEGFFSRLFSR